MHCSNSRDFGAGYLNADRSGKKRKKPYSGRSSSWQASSHRERFNHHDDETGGCELQMTDNRELAATVIVLHSVLRVREAGPGSRLALPRGTQTATQGR
jgi:hypothetical protein